MLYSNTQVFLCHDLRSDLPLRCVGVQGEVQFLPDKQWRFHNTAYKNLTEIQINRPRYRAPFIKSMTSHLTCTILRH